MVGELWDEADVSNLPRILTLSSFRRFRRNDVNFETGLLQGAEPFRVILVPNRAAGRRGKHPVPLNLDLDDRSQIRIGRDDAANTVLAVAEFLSVERNHDLRPPRRQA
jgi:hypothetical protein